MYSGDYFYMSFHLVDECLKLRCRKEGHVLVAKKQMIAVCSLNCKKCDSFFDHQIIADNAYSNLNNHEKIIY